MAEVEERIGDEAGEEPCELTAPDLGFAELVWSDYRAQLKRPESTVGALVRYLPRLLVNPSLQFAFLVRVAQKGPSPLLYAVRWLQVVLFSSEVYWFREPAPIRMGPGIEFPHPIGIIIGPGTRIGSGVRVYNNTNIGSDRHWTAGRPNDRVPWLGDRSIVYAYTAVQGPWRIGQDAVVGLRVVVEGDVPPGGLLTRKRLRRRGEWAGQEHSSQGAA